MGSCPQKTLRLPTHSAPRHCPGHSGQEIALAQSLQGGGGGGAPSAGGAELLAGALHTPTSPSPRAPDCGAPRVVAHVVLQGPGAPSQPEAHRWWASEGGMRLLGGGGTSGDMHLVMLWGGVALGRGAGGFAHGERGSRGGGWGRSSQGKWKVHSCAHSPWRPTPLRVQRWRPSHPPDPRPSIVDRTAHRI